MADDCPNRNHQSCTRSPLRPTRRHRHRTGRATGAAGREVRVRVAAAGVGPWDTLTREGRNATHPSLPLILGSDISGVVEAVGADVTNVAAGDEVFGVTNPQFVGAYTDAAIARLAGTPVGLTHLQAASVPVVAVTAWQMLFDYAKVAKGARVLIHGAGANVGAYAVQLARRAGLHVIATAGG